MKKNLIFTFSIIALLIGALLNQGCEDSSKNDALNQRIDASNQKIDELSKKLDAILQHQTEIQNRLETSSKFDAALQQDAIVSRIANTDYYYTTNLLANINESTLRINLALENDLKQQVSELKTQINDIQKQVKPQFGVGFETLRDQVDAIKRTTDQLQSDSQKIKSKLGIIF